MKKIAVLALVLLVFVGGYFGYQHYTSKELIKSATPTVKEATLRTKQIADFITSPSNATFAEIFKAANETVQKISELSITLESQNREANPDAIAAASDYLKAVQTLTRSINSIFRIRLDTRSASSAADDALEDLKSSNEYTRKYAKTRVDKALEKMKSNLDEMIAQDKEIVIAITNTETARANAAKYFPEDALLSPATLQELKKDFVKEEKKAE
ncbi:hypothetical protein [Comamonas sp.]|uniref:hypothetical protein n=1 Tax=Comamonas sp. TaxID=34028 RepID=UPI00258721EF|nr:hypothetical protein [Comamonas sp.]